MSEIEIRAINYFLAVVESGSLTAAAKRLDLTQPALTKAIRRLEDETGAPLFERGARGVVLTASGETFLRHARTVRSTMAFASNELEALREGRAGVVRIGAGQSWLIENLPEMIRIFRRAFPDVRLHVRGGLDGQLRAALRTTPLDFLLTAISEEGEEPDLVCTPLLADDYKVIAGNRHPLRKKPVVYLRDLLDYPWIMPGPTAYMTLRLEAMFRAAGLPPPDSVIETSELIQFKITLMREAPEMNYLSFHEVRDLKANASRGLSPLPVVGISLRRSTGIVTRRGIIPNPPAVEFAKIVSRVCQRQPSWAGEGGGDSFWAT